MRFACYRLVTTYSGYVPYILAAVTPVLGGVGTVYVISHYQNKYVCPQTQNELVPQCGTRPGNLWFGAQTRAEGYKFATTCG
jgi:hypothetical protein